MNNTGMSVEPDCDVDGGRWSVRRMFGAAAKRVGRVRSRSGVTQNYRKSRIISTSNVQKIPKNFSFFAYTTLFISVQSTWR